jgi:hypothetical protein
VLLAHSEERALALAQTVVVGRKGALPEGRSTDGDARAIPEAHGKAEFKDKELGELLAELLVSAELEGPRVEEATEEVEEVAEEVEGDAGISQRH